MQASQLRKLAAGEDHPNVISLELAFYEKVVQLLATRPDLKCTFVPRVKELHVVMAAPCTLGTSMENSGMDEAG